jgi:hypothetical protein
MQDDLGVRGGGAGEACGGGSETCGKAVTKQLAMAGREAQFRLQDRQVRSGRTRLQRREMYRPPSEKPKGKYHCHEVLLDRLRSCCYANHTARRQPRRSPQAAPHEAPRRQG